MENTELLLPSEIPAAVGREINIYFDNLLVEDADRYYIDVICEVGRHQNERWTFVPEAAGTYPLTVGLYRDPTTPVASVETVVTVSDTTTTGRAPALPVTALFIGDSTTAAGLYTEELLRLFASDSRRIELIGTRGEGDNRHEGRGGWTMDLYYQDKDSPFVFNSVFNFARYMEANGYRQLDYVGIHLGINDMFAPTGDDDVRRLIETKLPMLERMLDSIHEYNPSTIVGVMLAIPPSRYQDSFGNNYGAGQTRWRYKRNILLWNKEVMARFGKRRQGGIQLVPINVNLDTVHGMMSEQTPANSRSSRLVTRQSDGVHPSREGYAQMADVVYYWLNCQAR